jgi:CubicO group peptidase (beta-lactamase class C family)
MTADESSPVDAASPADATSPAAPVAGEGRLSRRSALFRLGLAGVATVGTAVGWGAPATAHPGRRFEAGVIRRRRRLYFPPATGTWHTLAPATAGWDADALQAALDYAGEQHSRGVVVLHRGRIVAERYWGPAGAAYVRDVGSAQKSISSMLAGIAMRTTGLRADHRVTRWLGAGWSGVPRAVERRLTVRHLLAQSNGLDEQLESVYEPGTAWLYSGAWFALHRVLAAATGTPVPEYARRVLFDPIGCAAGHWQRPRTDPYGVPELGLRTTARDFARLGLLALARGRWNGVDVIADDAYWEQALTPSQPTNEAYGWLWWLNGTATHRLPGSGDRSRSGALIPSAPPDLFCALGKGDQKLYVLPAHQVVIARIGLDAGDTPALSSFDRAWWELLAAALPAVD